MGLNWSVLPVAVVVLLLVLLVVVVLLTAAAAAAAIRFVRLNTNTAESPLAPRSTCNNGLVNTFTSLCNHTSLTEYGTVDEGT